MIFGRKKEDQNRIWGSITKEELKEVEDIIGHRFRNKSLLIEAMSHPSKNIEGVVPTYQRLAWLGDATLYHVLSEYLYENNPGVSTKELHDLRERYKKNMDLALVANEKLHISKYIITGKSRAGLEPSKVMLATMIEAIIGAISVESPKKARKFILNNIIIENK